MSHIVNTVSPNALVAWRTIGKKLIDRVYKAYFVGPEFYRFMSNMIFVSLELNTLRPKHNGHHIADDISFFFLAENVQISIKISLKFVPNDPINNIPALFQIMACRLVGAKPLSETMLEYQWWLVYWRIYASLGLNELTIKILISSD